MRMRRAPSFFLAEDIVDAGKWGCATYNEKHGWALARPLGLDTLKNRVRLAWMVFTGRADALVWRDQ